MIQKMILMQKTLLLLFISCFLNVKSQISITASSMPSSGDTIRYSSARLSSVGDYTTTGTNYNWHFDTLRPTSQGLREFKNGLNTPYYILFGLTAYGEKTLDTVPIPNIPVPGIPAISITDVYSFYSKTPVFSPTKFIAEGLGLKISGIPVPNTFSDEDELYFFPLNYSDRDSSTFRFSTITNTLIPFQYVKQGYRITEADGWGTVTTPFGTSNCLRVVTTQYSIDTIKGTVTLPIIGTQPFSFGFNNYQRSYQWLTTNEKIPYLEVSGAYTNAVFNPNQVKYRDGIQTFVGTKNDQALLDFAVFPNPASHQLNITTTNNNAPLKLELVDLQGKTVLTKDFSSASLINNHFVLDIANIAKGLYILNVSNLSGTQTSKISIQ